VVGARWLRVQAQQLGVRRVVSRPAGDASQDLERLVGEGKREKRVGREWGREGGRTHLIRRWRSARGWGRRRRRRGGLARLSGRGSGERRRKEEDARRLGRDDVRKRTRSTHSAFFFPFVLFFLWTATARDRPCRPVPLVPVPTAYPFRPKSEMLYWAGPAGRAKAFPFFPPEN
jgi:hypothetical protein